MRFFLDKHPHLSASVLLATAMEVVLYAASRNVALSATQYGAIAVATALLAALCVWILTWE